MILITVDVVGGIKMKELGFRDYDVRVWSGDVFINSFEAIGYVGGQTGEGVQINTEDQELHSQIVDVCRNIRNEFLKLDALINETIQ